MSANDKYLDVYRHPQAVKQSALIVAARAESCSNSQIIQMLDACSEDQRAADKALGEKVRADMNSYNAVRGRGRRRQVIAPKPPQKTTPVKAESKQQQPEAFDQAAFEADAMAAAKAFGKSQGRKAALA